MNCSHYNCNFVRWNALFYILFMCCMVWEHTKYIVWVKHYRIASNQTRSPFFMLLAIIFHGIKYKILYYDYFLLLLFFIKFLGKRVKNAWHVQLKFDIFLNDFLSVKFYDYFWWNSWNFIPFLGNYYQFSVDEFFVWKLIFEFNILVEFRFSRSVEYWKILD